MLSCIIFICKKKTNSSFLNLVKYSNGSYSYIISVFGAKIGQILNNIFIPLKFIKNFQPGCFILVKFLPENILFSNIFFKNQKFAKYIKAPGTYTKIFQKFFDMEFITFKLPTGLVKYLSFNNFVIVGRNSNISNFKQQFGKSGFYKNLGFKSIVRGVAMNPVDHPHGGRTKTNKPEVSPWG